MLTVLLGGARSGKSSLAQQMARPHDGPVTVIATGEPRDDEMAARIARHRAERPAEWETIEEPLDLSSALRKASGDAFVIVDCLTLWVSNALEGGWDDDKIAERATEAAALAAARDAPVVTVSNEVGWGIVPIEPLARRYRDVLGRTNAIWCEHAARALLIAAGRALPLARAAEVLGDG